MKSLLSYCIFLALFAPKTTFADVTTQAMQEVQNYPGTQYFVQSEIPTQLNDQLSYRFRRTGKGGGNFTLSLEVTNSSTQQTRLLQQFYSLVPSDNFMITHDQTSIFYLKQNSSNGELSLASANTQTNALSECSLPQAWASSYTTLVSTASALLIFSPVATNGTDIAIGVVQTPIQSGDCAIKSGNVIKVDDNSNFWSVSDGSIARLYSDQSKWGTYTGTEWIQEFLVDSSGTANASVSILGQSFLNTNPYCYPSVGKSGVLITSTESKYSNQRTPSVFLVTRDGQSKEIITNAQCASWTENGSILVSRGSHSGSHQLFLYSPGNYQQGSLIPQPVGYKAILSVAGNKVYYINEQATSISLAYSQNLFPVQAPVKLNWEVPLQLKYAKVPNLEEVVFESGARLVPGYLFTPDMLCSAIKNPRPAVIYLHGGNFTSYPNTQKVFTDENDETLLYTQIGDIVFKPGYFGDTFFGDEFLAKDPRFVDLERYAPQLEDVAAAVRYLKSLPCIDPNRIAIFGHSYGAMIGSNYIASTENLEQSSLKGIFLQSGIYSEDEYKTFGTYSLDEVASLEGDAARKHLSYSDLVSSQVPVLNPTSIVLDIKSALGLYQQSYYGVHYQLSEDFYQQVVGINNA